MDVTGKNILILGMAREGVSLARYLTQRGARVTITDSASEELLKERLESLRDLSIQVEAGGHHVELVSRSEMLFVSPGIPESNAVYRAAGKAELPVESMTTLFFAICPGRIVGVTGSSGKTTTTGLIGHILRTAGRNVVVGGNIGSPMLDLLPAIDAGSVVVLELSSFQLDLLRRSPEVAVVTNISPNHLDRHGTMERYIDAKLNIVRHQRPDDVAILNVHDTEMPTFAGVTPALIRLFGCHVRDGATIREGSLGLLRSGKFTPVIATEDVPLMGRHNLENVLAALATVDVLNVPTTAMADGVHTFRPAPHRLEIVGEHRGIRYIDDSIATTPERAMVALQAVEGPVLLIAGGRDKNLPWEDFGRLVVKKAKALYLLGEAAKSVEGVVREAITRDDGLLSEREIYRCESLESAVQRASEAAQPGDVVLLSPGCTSYDMFADFDQRGRVFAGIVQALGAA